MELNSTQETQIESESNETQNEELGFSEFSNESQENAVEMSENVEIEEEEQRKEDEITFEDLFNEKDPRKAFFQLMEVEDTLENRKALVENAKKKYGKVYQIDNDKVLDLVIKIFVVMCRFAKKGKNYAHNFNSNGNESYNNVITIFAPKRLDLERHYRMKCNQAVLRYNFGNDDWKMEVLHLLGFEVSENQMKNFEKKSARDDYHRARKKKTQTKIKRNESKKNRKQVSLENSKLNTKAKYKSKKQKKLGETFEEGTVSAKKTRKAPTCKSCGFPIKGGQHDPKCPRHPDNLNGSTSTKKRKREQSSKANKKRKLESQEPTNDDILYFDPYNQRLTIKVNVFGGKRNTIQKMMQIERLPSPGF